MVGTGLAAVGVPTLGKVIWWARRSMRADVKNLEYLENGNVKVVWQDETAEEIPRMAWDELGKRDRHILALTRSHTLKSIGGSRL